MSSSEQASNMGGYSRVTLKSGERMVCISASSAEWLSLDGEWLDKDSAAIAKVERGTLTFNPDPS